MNSQSVKKLFFLFSLLLLVSSAHAYSGGDGSAGNPYQVGSWTELESMNSDLSSHFILISDLAEGDGDYAGIGDDWEGIGDEGTPFTGSFDGQDYTIYNLTLSTDAGRTSNIGLFGWASGNITNLNIVSGVYDYRASTSIPKTNLGMIAGTLDGGRISNVNVQGYYYAYYNSGIFNGGNYWGGVVGQNIYGYIDNAVVDVDFVRVDVYGSGGIVGQGIGYITNCIVNTETMWTYNVNGGVLGYMNFNIGDGSIIDNITITNLNLSNNAYGSIASNGACGLVGGKIRDDLTVSNINFNGTVNCQGGSSDYNSMILGQESDGVMTNITGTVHSFQKSSIYGRSSFAEAYFSGMVESNINIKVKADENSIQSCSYSTCVLGINAPTSAGSATTFVDFFNDYGNFSFLGSVYNWNNPNVNMFDRFTLSQNGIYVDGTDAAFDIGANITLTNVETFEKPRLIKDGTLCSDCITYTDLDAEVVQFSTTEGGTYEIMDAPVKYPKYNPLGAEVVFTFDSTENDTSQLFTSTNYGGDGCTYTSDTPTLNSTALYCAYGNWTKLNGWGDVYPQSSNSFCWWQKGIPESDGYYWGVSDSYGLGTLKVYSSATATNFAIRYSTSSDNNLNLPSAARNIVEDGEWHHQCITVVDGDVALSKWYVDGVDVSATVGTKEGYVGYDNIPVRGAPCIGATCYALDPSNKYGEEWNHSFADFLVFPNRELTADEVQDIFLGDYAEPDSNSYNPKDFLSHAKFIDGSNANGAGLSTKDDTIYTAEWRSIYGNSVQQGSAPVIFGDELYQCMRATWDDFIMFNASDISQNLTQGPYLHGNSLSTQMAGVSIAGVNYLVTVGSQDPLVVINTTDFSSAQVTLYGEDYQTNNNFLVIGDKIYYTKDDTGNVIVRDLYTGDLIQRWENLTGGPESYKYNGYMASDGIYIYIQSYFDDYQFLIEDNGSLTLYEQTIISGSGSPVFNTYPLIANGYAYMGRNNKFYQIPRENISAGYTYTNSYSFTETPIYAEVDGNKYIYATDSNIVRQFDADDITTQLAEFTLDGVGEALIEYNGSIYLGDATGDLYQLNASDVSQQIAKLETGYQCENPPTAYDGYIYWSTQYGLVQTPAFDISYTGPSGDTCNSYSGTGTFSINASENCVVNTAIDVMGNDVLISGVGNILINQTIYNYSSAVIQGVDSNNKCYVTCQNGFCLGGN